MIDAHEGSDPRAQLEAIYSQTDAHPEVQGAINNEEKHRALVIVQGVVRSGDAGRAAISLLLKCSSGLLITPMRGALPSGAISPATPPDSWYTRGALPMDIPPRRTLLCLGTRARGLEDRA